MSQGRAAFPAEPPASGDANRNLRDFARRLLDFLKPNLPDVEFKSITTIGNFPLYVSTRINAPIDVRRCQTYETRNAGMAIGDTSIAWRVSGDPRQPGIFIDDMGGITVGTDYTVVLAIQGAW